MNNKFLGLVSAFFISLASQETIAQEKKELNLFNPHFQVFISQVDLSIKPIEVSQRGDHLIVNLSKLANGQGYRCYVNESVIFVGISKDSSHYFQLDLVNASARLKSRLFIRFEPRDSKDEIFDLIFTGQGTNTSFSGKYSSVLDIDEKTEHVIYSEGVCRIEDRDL